MSLILLPDSPPSLPSGHGRLPGLSRRAASLAALVTSLALTHSLPAESGPALAGAAANADSGSTTVLDPVIVTGQLDQGRQTILPNLGATSYRIDAEDIQNQSQGDNAPFNQVLLRAPGVAQDSAANGDLHVRGEHANLQYRINGVLLPEGITGFGLELDPRFVNNVQLITGSLPAQYGFRTAGIVDILTKSSSFERGGDASVYGGAYGTFRPSFEYADSTGRLSTFVDGSFDHNELGIENPTSQAAALHDQTKQYKAFAYASCLLDASSRLSVIVSASYSDFQVPDTAGLHAGTAPNGRPWLPGSFNSAQLNENQNEQNTYGVIAYQKSAGNLNYQLSGFGRASSVHFLPDPAGDLYFNGVASDVDRKLTSFGLQGDGSYALTDTHTLRAGVFVLSESVSADSTTTVFPVDSSGDPTGPAFAIADNHRLSGLFAGLYLQDEWHLLPHLSLNFGARCDAFNASFDREHQVSPRVNLVYELSSTATLHLGYARYFTPPPVENVSGASVVKFDGTSNASATDQDDPVKAERSNYFDAGGTLKLGSEWQVGLDGYYKRATHQLDDGLFGQTLILSAFNYAQGEVYGAELTASYNHGGFSAYANLARSEALGKNWSSAEFLFDPAGLAYVQRHWIHLDHDQRLSGSFGAAQQWTDTFGRARIYADVIYGTGLRTDATAADGSNLPNGGSVPAYATLNLGAEQSFRIFHHPWKVRLDLINVTDKSYELRDGTGVGVNAAQYGARFGAFGSIRCPF